MCPPDDIPNQNPPTQTERSKPEAATSRRSVGPESESRGGPEAVDETLDDSKGIGPPRPASGSGHQSIGRADRHSASSP